MADDNLLCELGDTGVQTISFNAPSIKNAIDTRAQRRLVTLLQDAARNPSVKVVVLTGTGNAFCFYCFSPELCWLGVDISFLQVIVVYF